MIHEADELGVAVAVHLPNGMQARLPVGMEPSRWVPMMRALRTC